MPDLYHVQHADKNASVKDYKHLAADELLVTKVFETIQGEGPFAGHPAIFVRLSGCNKGNKVPCAFCDTDFRLSQGQVTKIGDLILRARSSPIDLIVLTGGEPMLQDNIVPFLKEAWGWGKKVQIESNGDRLAKDYGKHLATLVVSPKVNPGSLTYQDLSGDVWDAADYFKFVVDAREGSPYNFLPNYAWDIPKEKIFVSPLAVYKREVQAGEVASVWSDTLLDKELTKQNYAYAARIAQGNSFLLSTQQHLLVNIE